MSLPIADSEALQYTADRGFCAPLLLRAIDTQLLQTYPTELPFTEGGAFGTYRLFAAVMPAAVRKRQFCSLQVYMDLGVISLDQSCSATDSALTSRFPGRPGHQDRDYLSRQSHSLFMWDALPFGVTAPNRLVVN
jgi:hypothetical protein